MALKFNTKEYEREAAMEERRLTQQGTQNPLANPNKIAAMKRMEEREQMIFQQRLAQGLIPVDPQSGGLKKQSFSSKLMQGTKQKILGFHYSMLERKRQNALMKQQDPEAYSKLVAERKEKHNIMNQPNLFDGRGRMKW